MKEIIFSAIQVKKILYKYLKENRGIEGINAMDFRDDGYGDFEMVVKINVKENNDGKE